MIARMWVLLVLSLAGFVAFAHVMKPGKPTLAQCCIDPKIPQTCAPWLYERDGAGIRRDGRCPGEVR